MIAILTDKPSVGKEIGRIIGATKVRNGYVEGNGYMVTWTFGYSTRSTLNVRTFNTKRAHVLDKMCARFFQTIRKVKIHTTAVTLIASLSDTFFLLYYKTFN
ncbi:hypothetical protein [Bacteroides caecigallinarum]|uniref:hypothetical protein n=1 Tax=Bacteroides caecigallinarum TaxID=1411144 RepID=UPI001F365247|nr:hypothetical protein [Bacteroides caecigallinarum]MCF2738348.1 hypothetical protein [Bacteroides caecigallinarum]